MENEELSRVALKNGDENPKRIDFFIILVPLRVF